MSEVADVVCIVAGCSLIAALFRQDWKTLREVRALNERLDRLEADDAWVQAPLTEEENEAIERADSGDVRPWD
ncbi:MAG: hypothetical protein ACPG4T_01555 [Nannocystaceae bacterium]